MDYRIGHDLLKGNTTLDRFTIIDINSKNYEFTVYSHKDSTIRGLKTDEEGVYAHLTNGIDQPETQDSDGHFTLEAKDDLAPQTKHHLGAKVRFKAEHQNALIEIEGYVIRNFWPNYYLISEQGVSVPNRYWKVGYDQIERVS
jgi:hypothetical protein